MNAKKVKLAIIDVVWGEVWVEVSCKAWHNNDYDFRRQVSQGGITSTKTVAINEIQSITY